MLKTSFIYTLLFLIAMQSTIAVADAHQSHQTGVEHLEFDIDKDSASVKAEKKFTNNFDNFPNIQFDCQHCCHCHGVTQLYISGTSEIFIFYKKTSKLSENFLKRKSRIISPDLRPPIV